MTTTSYASITNGLQMLKNHVLAFGATYDDAGLEVLGHDKKYVVFLSVGYPHQRAKVFSSNGVSFKRAYENIEKNVMEQIRKNPSEFSWLKVDIVTAVEQLSFTALLEELTRTKKNYFRKGIAFDASFKTAFLEQELQANVMISSDEPKRILDNNVNAYLKKASVSLPFLSHFYQNKDVYTFTTKSWMLDGEQVHALYDGPYMNGVRKVEDIENEMKNLAQQSTAFLAQEIQEDGKFIYGYFSPFDKEINFYNNLRHASTLYALLEGYEFNPDPEVLAQIEKAIAYLEKNMIVYDENKPQPTAYMVEADGKEIKLGGLGVTLIMLTKYMKLTGSTKYIDLCRAVARGIQTMRKEDGGFIHVLQYPELTTLEEFRTIYYNGEAAFGLIRLYELDRDEAWIEEVKSMFDYFIAQDMYKHGDHWLSYATNELTTYFPEDKYFEFGLKNCAGRLDYMYYRNTTFPTFLELMMACYKMVNTIKSLNKEYLLEDFDVEKLKTTIDRRAEYQRVGFFYPEQAMYMKNPSRILGGFFIRHHSFRVRIDDIEHYLSGYVQYLTYRAPDLKPKELGPITEQNFR